MAIGIVNKYARVFLNLIENKECRSSLEQLKILTESVCQEDIYRFFNSPIVLFEKKNQVLNSIVSRGEFNPMVVSFIGVIIKNKRLSSLKEIVEHYHRLIDKHNGVEWADLVVASEDDDKSEKLAVEWLEKSKKDANKSYRLTKIVDPAIIDGLILRFEGKQVDLSALSILRKLQDMEI